MAERLTPISTLVRVSDAATMLDCSEQTIRKLFNDGDLEGVRVGRVFKIKQASIEAFMARGGSRRQKTPAERADDIRRGFDPYCCNWCESLLADDPGDVWICGACLEASNRVRQRVSNEASTDA